MGCGCGAAERDRTPVKLRVCRSGGVTMFPWGHIDLGDTFTTNKARADDMRATWPGYFEEVKEDEDGERV